MEADGFIGINVIPPLIEGRFALYGENNKRMKND